MTLLSVSTVAFAGIPGDVRGPVDGLHVEPNSHCVATAGSMHVAPAGWAKETGGQPVHRIRNLNLPQRQREPNIHRHSEPDDLR